MVEYMLSVQEALNSIPTIKKKGGENDLENIGVGLYSRKILRTIEGLGI